MAKTIERLATDIKDVKSNHSMMESVDVKLQALSSGQVTAQHSITEHISSEMKSQHVIVRHLTDELTQIKLESTNDKLEILKSHRSTAEKISD